MTVTRNRAWRSVNFSATTAETRDSKVTRASPRPAASRGRARLAPSPRPPTRAPVEPYRVNPAFTLDAAWAPR